MPWLAGPWISAKPTARDSPSAAVRCVAHHKAPCLRMERHKRALAQRTDLLSTADADSTRTALDDPTVGFRCHAFGSITSPIRRIGVPRTCRPAPPIACCNCGIKAASAVSASSLVSQMLNEPTSPAPASASKNVTLLNPLCALKMGAKRSASLSTSERLPLPTENMFKRMYIACPPFPG